ncbi:uncharacterized protein LOC112568317 [Pomacea canaliculata]|uniref:uncharacterized protein LOC112568317 n=1 Tax=Pomacea canaliculata TaxID=400727 RepID=UPI000D73749C|nr:uncharacterized protein LOC112568317 [Pomacea canaliculata]
MCRCLRWNVGNYSFQKVVEKKDSGTWLLQFLDKGAEFKETLYIIAQDNDDREETNNSTITTITSITTTNIVIIACSGTVVIISVIIVVVCCCRWRSRKAARTAGTGPEGNIEVATRSRGGRCIQQRDSTAYTSPASVMTLREYAGIMTPQQLQQQTEFCSESSSNENIYGNISYPVKQNRWKIGQRCSRLVRRFLPLTTL